jgi:hypothetical protein
MNVDTELDIWRQQWQAQPAVPADLRRMVQRQSRNIRLMLIADILVTVAIGGYTAWWAIASARPSVIVLAIATWSFIAAAWIFALKSGRGGWRPSGENTAAFLDLSLRRGRARLRAIRFGAGLWVCEVLFCLAWVYHERATQEPLTLSAFLTSRAVMIVWICTLLFFAFLAWYQRKKRAEMAYLSDLRRQLGV